MNRKHFLASLMGMSILSSKIFAKNKAMDIEFFRHATFTLTVGGVTFLVDPMLSAKNALDPVANARTADRIPMVDLPFSEADLEKKLQDIDAIIVTHTHRDHWDVKAQSILNKSLPLISQPADAEKLKQQGFTNVISVDSEIEFKELKISRTHGQHGTGEIGTKMGPVSGFVIENGGKKLYIAGDTIWCEEVDNALKTHKPHVVILNSGAAQFNTGDPITMDSKDVIKTATTIPSAKIIVVHMETVNHCYLTRADLKKELDKAKLLKQCLIPFDGEKIHVS